MGSSSSKKSEDTTNIKAVEDMDEDELSSKDKLFKKAIEDLANEIKDVKNQKKDKFIYTVPKVDLCNWSLFWFNDIIFIILSIIKSHILIEFYHKHLVNVFF